MPLGAADRKLSVPQLPLGATARVQIVFKSIDVAEQSVWLSLSL